ncbi:MAG TPA: asparagine synthase (glutamine-hydrolyzing) [Cyclobacteriaceae bacterium]|nr:asparagine synthase (glutamine-hydrolyzing) [Cyclobacteriaceae bacterium]
MCGISGIYNFQSKKPVDALLLKQMCDSIAHRGPDGDGVFIDQQHHIGLGHRRLSIVDLATGGQPMTDESEDVWLIFNGEIYNYPDLKRELQAKGYHFRTTSDTEAIIFMYKEYGAESFARLNGIFAFAIFDKKNDCLVLARDHFGVKPLYYAFHEGSLLFGSEIKTILQHETFKREMDYQALNSFLTFRYNPSPQTLFKNIVKLYPGHYLKVTGKGETILQPYWKYRPKIATGITEAEAIQQYQHLLEQAVKRQMMSDVPVGLLLSGGVDSAVIGHLMQSVSTDRIKTFTIGFEGTGDYNELPDAKESAKFIGSEHFEMTISQKEYMDFFYKSFHYTEEPIGEMTIPALYYVSKLAASHVKVVLAGQGADEPLAGYKRYFGEQKINQYFSVLNKLPMTQVAKLLPRNERFKRAAYASRFSNEVERFLAIYTIFTPEQKVKLLNPDLQRKINGQLTDISMIERLYNETAKLDDSLSRILYIDTRMSLSDNLLLFGDKMSMANSLEMRVPFLDVPLIEFIESLPPEMKLHGNVHKYIHKQAVKKWLPDNIIYRKKRGFATPMDQWLQSDLANVARDLFNDSQSASRKYFNIEYVNQLLDKHQNKKENYQRAIFGLLSFEIWHKSFFESKPVNQYS